MKRTVILLMLLLVMQQADALIVSVKGEGEVPEKGMTLTVTEGEADILSGRYTMGLEGDLLSDAAVITIRITRSTTGLTDEFCCANNCTAGNGETKENKQFNISGLAHWYTHYVPEAGSDETIEYIFDDGADSRVLLVRYVYNADAVEQVDAPVAKPVKQMIDGRVLIEHNGQWYTPHGLQICK